MSKLKFSTQPIKINLTRTYKLYNKQTPQFVILHPFNLSKRLLSTLSLNQANSKTLMRLLSNPMIKQSKIAQHEIIFLKKGGSDFQLNQGSCNIGTIEMVTKERNLAARPSWN